jgi:hypothetical protein
VRPHYGGTLTVELSSAINLNPAAANTGLSMPVAETLVREGSNAEIKPLLAVAWQHDPDFKRWRFSLRPKVAFQDGEALTAATAVPSLLGALKPRYGEVSIEAGGQALVIESDRAMPDLLQELALTDAAIFRKGDTVPYIGTGPFRITAWEPGRRLTLAAFEDYWNGRPFLDAVAIEFGAGRGRADLFDIPAGPARRILPEGWVTWSSQPEILVAIAAAGSDPALLQALALLIDRAPIGNVLAQHKGETAFGLLPQWLSGYAFLFQSSPDAFRAKQLVSQMRLGTIGLTYPANDLFLRSVAERVALNARDVGLSLQPAPQLVSNVFSVSSANGALRLVELPLESTAAAHELKRIADLVGAGGQADQLEPAKPETLYQLERSLLEGHRIIPLVHLRETYGIAPRVHFQTRAPARAAGSFALHLEDVWLQP